VWGPKSRWKWANTSRHSAGLLKVNVHASSGNAFDNKLFYISKDGSKLMLGNIFDVQQNPFKQDLDKLKTEFQRASELLAPRSCWYSLAIFNASSAKTKQMVRTNVGSTYPKQVRVYFKDFPLEQIHPGPKWPPSPAAVSSVRTRRFLGIPRLGLRSPAGDYARNIKSKLLDFAKEKEIDSCSWHAAWTLGRPKPK